MRGPAGRRRRRATGLSLETMNETAWLASSPGPGEIACAQAATLCGARVLQHRLVAARAERRRVVDGRGGGRHDDGRVVDRRRDGRRVVRRWRGGRRRGGGGGRGGAGRGAACRRQGRAWPGVQGRAWPGAHRREPPQRLRDEAGGHERTGAAAMAPGAARRAPSRRPERQRRPAAPRPTRASANWRRRVRSRHQPGGQRAHDGHGGARHCRHARPERDPPQHRCLGEPGQRPHREPQAAERDAQERAHDARVELLACAARDLLARRDRVARVLVGARGGDDVEDVGDRDDAPGQRDVLTRAAVRVALAVPALVVVGDRVRPLSQPRAQRLGHARAELGVAADQPPLLVRRLPRFVEHLRGYLELADVVQQRSPVEAIHLVAPEMQLLRDHLRVGADALGVASRDAIVRVQSGDETEQPLRRLHRRACVAARSRPLDAPLELGRRAGAQCRAEARRRLVRKHEGELEQGREREQAARQAVDADQDTVAPALRPTHQATCPSAEPLGGPMI